jgi:hypothetical protein
VNLHYVAAPHRVLFAEGHLTKGPQPTGSTGSL